MVEAKPPSGIDKSASQKELKKKGSDDDELSDSEDNSKNLKRNPSETPKGMQLDKKEDSVGSAIRRKRTGARGSGSEGQGSRGSGSRIAKIPRDPKAEKVSYSSIIDAKL